jgi:hypothetical protein
VEGVVLLYGLAIIGPAVGGALIYAAGVRRSRRAMRVLGVAVIFAPFVVWFILAATTGD